MPNKKPLSNYAKRSVKLKVGMTGFEPATSCSQSRRSSQAELHPVMAGSLRLGQLAVNTPFPFSSIRHPFLVKGSSRIPKIRIFLWLFVRILIPLILIFQRLWSLRIPRSQSLCNAVELIQSREMDDHLT